MTGPSTPNTGDADHRHPDDPPPPPKIPAWILGAIGVAALAASLTVSNALGLVLLALAVGMWVQMPDPEADERRARRAAEAAAEAARPRARTVTPLRPTGTIEFEGAPAPARSLDGWVEAGTEVEVVNRIGEEWIVRHAR